MKIAFTNFGFSDYIECQADKRVLKKVNALIKNIERNGPQQGTGKVIQGTQQIRR